MGIGRFKSYRLIGWPPETGGFFVLFFWGFAGADGWMGASAPIRVRSPKKERAVNLLAPA